MGKERTKLNPVIMESSIFMISSFCRLSSSISALVISRDSMKLKSSFGFFLLPKTKAAVDDFVAADTDGMGANPEVRGAMAPRRARIRIKSRDIVR